MVDVLLLIFILMLVIISYQIHSLKHITIKGVLIMSALSDAINGIGAGVASNATIIGSVEQLVTNLAAAVASLTAQLAAGGVDPALVAQAQALQTALETKNAEFAAFVVANTPAAVGAVGSAPRPPSKPIDQK
jgi:hypothetical protein